MGYAGRGRDVKGMGRGEEVGKKWGLRNGEELGMEGTVEFE